MRIIRNARQLLQQHFLHQLRQQEIHDVIRYVVLFELCSIFILLAYAKAKHLIESFKWYKVLLSDSAPNLCPQRNLLERHQHQDYTLPLCFYT